MLGWTVAALTSSSSTPAIEIHNHLLPESNYIHVRRTSERENASIRNKKRCTRYRFSTLFTPNHMLAKTGL